MLFTLHLGSMHNTLGLLLVLACMRDVALKNIARASKRMLLRRRASGSSVVLGTHTWGSAVSGTLSWRSTWARALCSGHSYTLSCTRHRGLRFGYGRLYGSWEAIHVSLLGGGTVDSIDELTLLQFSLDAFVVEAAELKSYRWTSKSYTIPRRWFTRNVRLSAKRPSLLNADGSSARRQWGHGTSTRTCKDPHQL